MPLESENNEIGQNDISQNQPVNPNVKFIELLGKSFELKKIENEWHGYLESFKSNSLFLANVQIILHQDNNLSITADTYFENYLVKGEINKDDFTFTSTQDLNFDTFFLTSTHIRIQPSGTVLAVAALNHQDIKDIDGNPLIFKYDHSTKHWNSESSSIQFGQNTFTNVCASITEKKLSISGDTTVCGIELTFQLNDDHSAFISFEDINFVHIVTNFTHNLTGFSITKNGNIYAILFNQELTDIKEHLLELKYHKESDSWKSTQSDTILYAHHKLTDAHIMLNDYEFILKGNPVFADNPIEFTIKKLKEDGSYFSAEGISLNIGNNIISKADVKIFQDGNTQVTGRFIQDSLSVEMNFKDGQYIGEIEETLYYQAPEKGFFDSEQYYRLHKIDQFIIDPVSKTLSIRPRTLTVSNPYIFFPQVNDTNYQSETVALTYDSTDQTYKAEIEEQTVYYKGRIKDKFLSLYQYEESKKYIYNPTDQSLKVGSRYIKGHGYTFYRTVYNYYYKNFETYSHYEGIWPLRSKIYDYFYQTLFGKRAQNVSPKSSSQDISDRENTSLQHKSTRTRGLSLVKIGSVL